MSEFYAIDSTRVSLREYWWGTKSPFVIIGWILKLLRIRIPSSTDDPNVDSTLPFVVGALPPNVSAAFQDLTNQFVALGFEDPVFHVIFDAGTRTTIYWATFRHSSGRHFARIHHRLWQQAQKANRGVFPMFFTQFTDGTFLVSSAAKPDTTTPSSVQMNRMYGAPAIVLWTRHEELANSLSASKMIAPVSTRDELIQASERHHVLLRDFHLARGVFRPRTEKEKAKAGEYATSVEQARSMGQAEAEVFAELERLQHQKTGWRAIIWILLGSVVVFIAIGAAQWKWQTTLLLVPVLFFHEAGHWVAMRAFGYKNLRMFFIPAFGAAVVGRHWNVPGWKKALVSLAGPVPGIMAGVVFAIAGLITHRDWMNNLALLLFIINGFNLAPVLPLDGGHVLQATLFCRNRWLDAAFRIVTIVGLLVFGLFRLSRGFFLIAIAMTMALPIVFKLAKVAEDLRRTPLPPPLPGDDRIPVATAQTIIAAVRAAFPPRLPLNNKTLAQHTLNVYENLNATPPGPFGTLALLALQGGSFVVALIFCFVLVINKSSGLGDFAKAALRQPQHSLQCGTIQNWTGGATQPKVRNFLVASASNRSKARDLFADLTNRAPANSSVELLGDSVILALAAGDDSAREKWYDELQSRSSDVFVALSNAPVIFSITFIAPTAETATNLTRELREYLALSSTMHLIAPWSAEARSATYIRHRHARSAWQKISQEVGGVWRDPSLKVYDARSTAARKRGAIAEATRIMKERTEKMHELQDGVIARLRKGASQEMSDLLELNRQLSALSYTNRVERKQVYRKVAAKLGEVAYDGNRPDSVADALGTNSGSAVQHGLLLEVRWVGFNDATRGPAAFTEWLCGQGCRQMRYEFTGAGFAYDGDFSDGGGDDEE
jgi:Zn-dependent protease